MLAVLETMPEGSVVEVAVIDVRVVDFCCCFIAVSYTHLTLPTKA